MNENAGMIDTIKKVYRRENFIGFYRGCIPPFIGSIAYRSIQFSVFELFYTKWDTSDTMRATIPYTGGLQYRVVAAGLLAASARSVIECPFEYAKVKR